MEKVNNETRRCKFYSWLGKCALLTSALWSSTTPDRRVIHTDREFHRIANLKFEIDPTLELLAGSSSSPPVYCWTRWASEARRSCCLQSWPHQSSEGRLQLDLMGSTTRTGWVFFLLACGNFQIDDIDQQSRVGCPGCFRQWLEEIGVGVDGRSAEEVGSMGVSGGAAW
jgi:hypothetical protein